MSINRFATHILHKLPEEAAHDLVIRALKRGWVPAQPDCDAPALRQQLWGLSFTSPIGLAAGFDKNAEALQGLARQGFGFLELGTVTPKPQSGNARPRLFRLMEDQAIINRCGFNNVGIEAFLKNFQRWKNRNIGSPVVLGINIGKNKDTEDAAEDYCALLEKVYAVADYVTVNISSPNTPGLRELQKSNALAELLEKIQNTMESLHDRGPAPPLLVKIAPDVTAEEQAAIAEVVLQHQVDGLIVGNTTIGHREHLQNTRANEQGGLSGKPLFAPSTAVLQQMYRLTQGALPLIGVGGVFTVQEAYQKIRAGASLVQLYTALIYEGFDVVTRINQELVDLLTGDGFTHISEAIGVDAKK